MRKENFKCYIDLTNINDSMELESGQEIAEYEKDGYRVTLEVCGDVRINYQNTSYRSVHSFPDELKQIIHDRKISEHDDVYVDMNNWFEVFFWIYHEKERRLEWTGFSDVVDAESMTVEETESFLKDCYDDYYQDYYNYQREQKLLHEIAEADK